MSGVKPKGLVEIYSCIANFALGYSCFHVLAVNVTLLPAPVRPGPLNRTLLSGAGFYFLTLAGVTVYFEFKKGNVGLGTTSLVVMGSFLLILLVYAFRARRDRGMEVAPA
jgi:hypothetical protein